MKRLILCLDGTWDDASQNLNRLTTTNIWRLSRAISPSQDGVCNVIYYESGIGSEDPGLYARTNAKVQNLIEGAFGVGLADKVNKAYLFVATNWQKGDELYIFGFSRGAYTARLVAALVADLGIMNRVQLENFPHLFDAYQKRNSINKQEREQAEQVVDAAKAKAQPASKDLPFLIDFLGVFDTVGALGIPAHFMPAGKLNYLGFKDTILSPRVRVRTSMHAFHKHTLSSGPQHARHALALNETRKDFLPTKWTRDPDHAPPPEQTVKQMWFAGAHADIGGGWVEGDLAYLTQFWMLEQVHQTTGLRFDVDYLLSLPRPSNPRYGALVPHNSITQGSAFMTLAQPHYRDAQSGNHELFHASLAHQDLSKWDSEKLRATVKSAKLSILEGAEKLLESKWSSFPKLDIKADEGQGESSVTATPGQDTWGVYIRKLANDAIYFWVDKDAPDEGHK